MRWPTVLSAVAGAVVGAAVAGMVGPGVAATFSDTVTVAQRIEAGHLDLEIESVDGVTLREPDDSFAVADRFPDDEGAVAHQLVVRNVGTVDATRVVLRTGLTGTDLSGLRPALTVTVSTASGTATDERPVAAWLESPKELPLRAALSPGQAMTVTLHLSGTLTGGDEAGDADGDTDSNEESHDGRVGTIELTYRVTGYDA